MVDMAAISEAREVAEAIVFGATRTRAGL